MAYFDGFVIAVPSANKEAFVKHAEAIDPVFIEAGATRVVECWQDDVPKGKETDFFKAVQAKEDEAVIFSFVEWPDKETRDAAMAKIEDMAKDDARFDMEKNPMPFDGGRMVMGSFVPVFSLEA